MFDRFEDNNANELTPDILMIRGANKYKQFAQQRKWKVPDNMENELLVLKPELKKSKTSK